MSPLRIRKRARTSIEASSTVSRSGSFGTKNGMRGETIGGAVPSAQNSGLRRFWSLARVFLLFFREALNELDAAVKELALALLALPLFEFSSTGR